MKWLLFSALVIFFAGVLFWGATGANTGWTTTSSMVKTVDEVTGIEGVTYQKRFSPGIDFLAVVSALSGGMALAAWIFKKPRKP